MEIITSVNQEITGSDEYSWMMGCINYGFGYCRTLDCKTFGQLVDKLLKEYRDGELLVVEFNEFAKQLNKTQEISMDIEKKRWEELYKSIGAHK